MQFCYFKLGPIRSVTVRGFLTSKLSGSSTTERSSTNSSSLLDLGLPFLSYGADNKNLISEEKTRGYKSISAVDTEGVVTGHIWRSNISDRAVVPEIYHDVGPYTIGDELLLQCEVLHGE